MKSVAVALISMINLISASLNLTCDPDGNCMLKNELSVRPPYSDNSLSCDAYGNCMLTDSLVTRFNSDLKSDCDKMKAKDKCRFWNGK